MKLGGILAFFVGLFITGFMPVVADVNTATDDGTKISKIDGREANVAEMSSDDIENVANIMENQEDQTVVQYESCMLRMGWDNSSQEYRSEIFEKIKDLKDALKQNLEELSDNAKAMEENEQSLANRTLTAVTTAAMGLGSMELARGLSEQKADKKAEQDMTAYIETFRCEYGNGKSVKFGAEPIELPGGNDETIMNLRNEYFNLATSLKERKEALGLKPGIESEVVLDKSQIGLYDDENIGITNGVYTSLYRAKALDNENDQTKIDEEKEKSEKRVKYGAIATAAGAVIGIVGNQILNHDKHNRSKEILAKREDIKRELSDVMQFEINDCNAKIKEKKDWAKEKKRTSEYRSNQGLRDFVKEIESLQYLNKEDDIKKLMDHPICN